MRKYNNLSNLTGKIIENARLAKNLSREELAQKLQLLRNKCRQKFYSSN